MHPGKNWSFSREKFRSGGERQDNEEADFGLCDQAARGGKLKFSRDEFPAPGSGLPSRGSKLFQVRISGYR
jgi:hypothetical protein